MLANPDKFQAIALSKINSLMSHKLNVYDDNIETTKSIKLIGIEIDHQLRINQHISTLCIMAAMLLVGCVYGKNCKTAIMDSFIFLIFNYYPLVWHFCSLESSRKVENASKSCLSLELMTTKVKH